MIDKLQFKRNEELLEDTVVLRFQYKRFKTKPAKEAIRKLNALIIFQMHYGDVWSEAEEKLRPDMEMKHQLITEGYYQ
jgi:hypothetical protein